MNIASIDNTINDLIESIKDSREIKTNDMIKARLSFQLTKVRLGLSMINRIMRLYEIQGKVEEKLFKDEIIETASVRELMVINSLTAKAMDRYYGRMDKILSSLNLKEIETSLLMLASEMDKGSPSLESGYQEEIRPLTIDVLQKLSNLQDIQHGSRVVDPNESTEYSDMVDTLDKVVDDEEFLVGR